MKKTLDEIAEGVKVRLSYRATYNSEAVVYNHKRNSGSLKKPSMHN